jgi:GTP-binding protein HflX
MVALSATDRESTRGLLGKIAERLETRWAEAAMVPTFGEGEGEVEAEGGWGEREGEAEVGSPELTSLSDLLGWSRRGRAARV